MGGTIRFGSADDLKSYTLTPLANAETDTIVLKDIDVSAGSVVSVGGNTQGTLYINYSHGSLTACVIKVYGSYVGDPGSGDWYTETDEADSSGVLTLNPLSIAIGNADFKGMWHFPIGAMRALKITTTTTGTVTSSAITLNLALRSN